MASGVRAAGAGAHSMDVTVTTTICLTQADNVAKTCDLVGIVDTRCEGTRSMMSLGFVNTRTLDMSTRHEGTWLPL